MHHASLFNVFFSVANYSSRVYHLPLPQELGTKWVRHKIFEVLKAVLLKIQLIRSVRCDM